MLKGFILLILRIKLQSVFMLINLRLLCCAKSYFDDVNSNV